MSDDLATWLTQIWDEDVQAIGEPQWERVEFTADGVRVYWKSGSEGEYSRDGYASLLAAKQWTALARIAADRQILADYEDHVAAYRTDLTPFGEGQRSGLLLALARIAEAHADRPGYREEWRP